MCKVCASHSYILQAHRTNAHRSNIVVWLEKKWPWKAQRSPLALAEAAGVSRIRKMWQQSMHEKVQSKHESPCAKFVHPMMTISGLTERTHTAYYRSKHNCVIRKKWPWKPNVRSSLALAKDAGVSRIREMWQRSMQEERSTHPLARQERLRGTDRMRGGLWCIQSRVE